jgi:hypothetical protein
MASYQFDRRSTLVSRISLPPPVVLDYLQKLDSRPDYIPVIPSGPEMQQAEAAISQLPPLTKEVMQKCLIGIYFIKDFASNGLTDWVMDDKGGISCFMVFNAAVFGKNMSRLLTEKEKTCFINDDPTMDIRIDCGPGHSGFLYILLHESTHLVDYVTLLTPYVDDTVRPFLKSVPADTIFTRKIWAGYDKPEQSYSFTGRVFFYGFKKPALRMSDAPKIYSDLARSPFVSLYGSLSWAEDIAELTTMHHATTILGGIYSISVIKQGKKLLEIKPMNSPKVRRRLPLLSIFYRAGSL